MSDANKTGDVTPADPTPADVAREEPRVEPAPAPLVEPGDSFDRGPVVDHVETYDREPVSQPAPPTGEPSAAEPVEVHQTAPVQPVETVAPVAAPAAAPAPNIVYVSTPVPPRARGNRGIGTLLAVLGAAVFAVVYAAAVAAVTSFRVPGNVLGSAMTSFLTSAAYLVPVVLFLIAFVLVVLVLNRAGWWAHVLGSLVVAFAVYFGSIGILLFLSSGLFGGGEGNDFVSIATFPAIIVAGIVAREVSIWVGLGIAARGRRLTVKNREARSEFEREQAERRAEHERSTSA